MPDLIMLIKPASGACNMRCRYCFYYGAPEHNLGIMTEETLDALMRRAFEYAGDRRSQVSFAWQGGEPTLAGTEYFKKAVELAKKYNTVGHRVSFALQTNGYNVPEELIELFAKEHFLVGVSLDGCRDLHDLNRIDVGGNGTYARVLKTIKNLDKYKVDYNILCVISKAVARSPVKVYDALTKAGFNYLQFIPCLDEGEPGPYSLNNEVYGKFLCAVFDRWFADRMNGKQISIRDFDNYVMKAAGYPSEICTMRGICGCYFTVESNGDVFPCDFYVTPEWKMGNLIESSLTELISSEAAVGFIEDSKNHPESCRKCPWYGFCGSGCRRQRESNGVSRFCEAYKTFFEYAADRIIYLTRTIGK